MNHYTGTDTEMLNKAKHDFLNDPGVRNMSSAGRHKEITCRLPLHLWNQWRKLEATLIPEQ